MNREDTSAEQPRPRWFIDVDWFPQNSRSFSALAQGCLCPTCHERFNAESGETDTDNLVATIRDCCSKRTGFISRELPIMESVFRFFLANGNQPSSLEELSRGLDEWRGGDSYRTAPEMLSRLLENDQYYGLRASQPEEPGDSENGSTD